MTIFVYADSLAAEEAFYAAFSAIDLAGMEAVWARGAEALCIHPGGGLLRGREAVMTSWMELFSGTEPPAIEYRLMARFEAADLAVHLVEELIRPSGQSTNPATRVFATNVYLYEAGSWHMVEHHASLPLVERGGGDRDDRQLH